MIFMESGNSIDVDVCILMNFDTKNLRIITCYASMSIISDW